MKKYQDPFLSGQILEFARSVAIVGLSTNPNKDSHVVAKFLQNKGLKIIPVHPKADQLLGEKVYKQVADVTEQVDIVNVFRPSHECPEYARQAVQIDAKVLWLQLNISSEQAAMIAAAAGIHVIMNLCIKIEYNRHYPSPIIPHNRE
ncbi:MAG: CoA-binding protein [Bacteroidetes bacterium]|nr:CoA-binding protein [Bacteroidota bacterium]MCY4206081.1 CoA-binding protein [Bacteroidota bacterium]